MVGGGSFKICLSRKCCAARIRSLKGGTGFPGVNLVHDGNEFRLVETVYIRFIPYQSSMSEWSKFKNWDAFLALIPNNDEVNKNIIIKMKMKMRDYNFGRVC